MIDWREGQRTYVFDTKLFTYKRFHRLHWRYLGSESVYEITFGTEMILYLRIPDYGWQENQPRIIIEKSERPPFYYVDDSLNEA